MKIIGLTGNSGSGKTAVCDILRPFGAYIIDADKIARDVVEPGEAAYVELVNCFGTGILHKDGTLNRKKLAGIAFPDGEKRRRLTAVTHKHIIARMMEEAERIRANPDGYRFIVFDAPLLVEAGLHKVVSEVWLVHAPEETKMRRIIARDGLTADEALARLNAQPSFETLAAYADRIIENDGNLGTLKSQVEEAAKQIVL